MLGTSTSCAAGARHFMIMSLLRSIQRFLAQLQNAIQDCVNAVGEFECHTGVQEEALSIHIDNVCFWDSVLTQSDQLSDHDLGFDTMSQA
jgi:hypothetical protein